MVATEECAALDLNAVVTGGRDGFAAYVVSGDSMPEIPHGSLIFVDTWAEGRNGSVIAAEVNGQICVKKFERSERRLRLVSTNDIYPPREIMHNEIFRVLGVVKAHLVFHTLLLASLMA